jgi:predicted DNA-binding protein (MmcQ/YjbR family)
MNAAALRRACLAMTGAEETFPFGPENSVFKVEGKIFAITRLTGVPLAVSLKCEPGLAEQLRVTEEGR